MPAVTAAAVMVTIIKVIVTARWTQQRVSMDLSLTSPTVAVTAQPAAVVEYLKNPIQIVIAAAVSVREDSLHVQPVMEPIATACCVLTQTAQPVRATTQPMAGLEMRGN